MSYYQQTAFDIINPQWIEAPSDFIANETTKPHQASEISETLNSILSLPTPLTSSLSNMFLPVLPSQSQVINPEYNLEKPETNIKFSQFTVSKPSRHNHRHSRRQRTAVVEEQRNTISQLISNLRTILQQDHETQKQIQATTKCTHDDLEKLRPERAQYRDPNEDLLAETARRLRQEAVVHSKSFTFANQHSKSSSYECTNTRGGPVAGQADKLADPMMGWPETTRKENLDEDSLTRLIQRTTLDSSPKSLGMSPSNEGMPSDNNEFGSTLDLNDEYVTDFSMFGGQRKHDYKLSLYGDVKVYLGWGLSGDSLGDGGYGSSVYRNLVSKRGVDNDIVFQSSPSRKRQRTV
ncbi:unnamed protein product [Ambrosiozyma monospora]|uniref:Unnamed protein product n=1 Tax=Ambrosiozyma monospora TaxID=43982 RepID=A0A9W6YKL8_AMBMO|nr:unnamed protein product [Ambrosiozyma monospora]